MDFQKLSAEFKSAEGLNGLALFSPGGQMLDSSLLMSDDKAEELFAPLQRMLTQCQEMGRRENRFIIATDQGTIVFCALGTHFLLVHLKDNRSIDPVMKTIAWHRKQIQKPPEPGAAITPPASTKAPVPMAPPKPEELTEINVSENTTPVPATPTAAKLNLTPAPATASPISPAASRPTLAATTKPRSKALYLIPVFIVATLAAAAWFISQEPAPVLTSDVQEEEIGNLTSSAEQEALPLATQTQTPELPNPEPALPEKETFNLVLKGNFPPRSGVMKRLAKDFLSIKGYEVTELNNDQSDVLTYTDSGDEQRVLLHSLSLNEPPFGLTTIETTAEDHSNTVLLTSFRLRPPHEDLLDKQGFQLDRSRNELAIAMDAVVVITPEENLYRNLTFVQLNELLSGGLKSWERYSYGDTPIHIYTLPWHRSNLVNLGHDLFGPLGTRLSSEIKAKYTAQEVLDAVRADKGAIGILPASLLPKDVKAVGVFSPVDDKPKAPGKWNISTLTYPLSHFVYSYISSDASPLTREFQKYLASDPARKILEDSGYVRPRVPHLREDGKEEASDIRAALVDQRPKELRDFTKGATRSRTPELLFYWPGGPVPPEELAGLVAKTGTDLTYKIVAHAGDPDEDTEQVAKWMASELRKQGAKHVEIFGASNSVLHYRKKDKIGPRLNYRVELWTSQTAP